MEQLISSFFAGGTGAGLAVYLVLKIKFAALDEKINETKKTAVRAHSRLDSHLQNHH
jgi:hypothetical protein